MIARGRQVMIWTCWKQAARMLHVVASLLRRARTGKQAVEKDVVATTVRLLPSFNACRSTMSPAQLKCSRTGTCVHHPAVPRLYRNRATICAAQLQNGGAEQTYPQSPFVTGGRFGTSGSSRSLVPDDRLPLLGDKQIVFVRHGSTTWNAEKRIQGSSDESHLTEYGREQVFLLCALQYCAQCRHTCKTFSRS